MHTGEKAVIVKVIGHGGFRKRIVEMGFIKGTTVEVLLNAPLQDPVKYRILGYEVSLRHDEAKMIEVISEREAKDLERSGKLDGQDIDFSKPETEDIVITDSQLHDAARKRRRQCGIGRKSQLWQDILVQFRLRRS